MGLSLFPLVLKVLGLLVLLLGPELPLLVLGYQAGLEFRQSLVRKPQDSTFPSLTPSWVRCRLSQASHSSTGQLPEEPG